MAAPPEVSDDFMTYKVGVLRELCTEHGMSSDGKKMQLVSRLNQWCDQQESEQVKGGADGSGSDGKHSVVDKHSPDGQPPYPQPDGRAPLSPGGSAVSWNEQQGRWESSRHYSYATGGGSRAEKASWFPIQDKAAPGVHGNGLGGGGTRYHNAAAAAAAGDPGGGGGGGKRGGAKPVRHRPDAMSPPENEDGWGGGSKSAKAGRAEGLKPERLTLAAKQSSKPVPSAQHALGSRLEKQTGGGEQSVTLTWNAASNPPRWEDGELGIYRGSKKRKLDENRSYKIYAAALPAKDKSKQRMDDKPEWFHISNNKVWMRPLGDKGGRKAEIRALKTKKPAASGANGGKGAAAAGGVRLHRAGAAGSSRAPAQQHAKPAGRAPKAIDGSKPVVWDAKRGRYQTSSVYRSQSGDPAREGEPGCDAEGFSWHYVKGSRPYEHVRRPGGTAPVCAAGRGGSRSGVWNSAKGRWEAGGFYRPVGIAAAGGSSTKPVWQRTADEPAAKVPKRAKKAPAAGSTGGASGACGANSGDGASSSKWYSGASIGGAGARANPRYNAAVEHATCYWDQDLERYQNTVLYRGDEAVADSRSAPAARDARAGGGETWVHEWFYINGDGIYVPEPRLDANAQPQRAAAAGGGGGGSGGASSSAGGGRSARRPFSIKPAGAGAGPNGAGAGRAHGSGAVAGAGLNARGFQSGAGAAVAVSSSPSRGAPRDRSESAAAFPGAGQPKRKPRQEPRTGGGAAEPREGPPTAARGLTGNPAWNGAGKRWETEEAWCRRKGEGAERWFYISDDTPLDGMGAADGSSSSPQQHGQKRKQQQRRQEEVSSSSGGGDGGGSSGASSSSSGGSSGSSAVSGVSGPELPPQQLQAEEEGSGAPGGGQGEQQRRRRRHELPEGGDERQQQQLGGGSASTRARLGGGGGNDEGGGNGEEGSVTECTLQIPTALGESVEVTVLLPDNKVMAAMHGREEAIDVTLQLR